MDPAFAHMTMSTRTELLTTHQKFQESLDLVAQLKACAQQKDLNRGGRLHVEISRKGFLKNNIFVGSALVSMYAKCGALVKAQKVFDDLPFRNLVSWNGLIAGYVQEGLGEQALICLHRLQEDGLSPDARTFTCVLKACGTIGAVETGKELYAKIVRDGLLGLDIVLGNALIDMFAKFGALARAQQVFDELPVPNIVSWNTLIAGFCHHGCDMEAFKCFEKMKYEGLCPDVVTFSCILMACGNVEIGQKIHDEICRSGFLMRSCWLCTELVHMYAKCGALAKAQEVFDQLSTHDLVTWTALITGYCQHDYGEHAIECFGQMRREGFSPDAVTFVSVLKACGSIGVIEKGEEIHAEIIREGLFGEVVVLWSAIVDMYMKCGALGKAREIFNEIPSRDVISWTALISGYCDHGHGEEALRCFGQMKSEGLSPDAVSFTCILRTCSSMGAAEKGQFYFNSMSMSYGIIPTAEHHMCMVNLFGHVGQFGRVMEVLEKICFSADVSMWFALMQSCQKWGNVKVGRLAFEHALRLNKDTILAYVYMCNIYAAVGMHEEARRLLAKAQQLLLERSAQDVVAWNNLITGYCQNEYNEDALDCFELMKQVGLSPDVVTFACILKACSSMRARERGKKIHAEIIEKGIFGKSTALWNALVDMYAKCGAFVKAESILHELPVCNCISWTALITGYSQHGYAEEALDCFEQMQHEGLHPDAVTFACILNACGSLGAADKGEMLHFEIVRLGLLEEDVVLGNALVDMYAKCGLQTKAQHVFDELPVRNVVSWNALITGYCQFGHCKKAFEVVECMKHEGLLPDGVTFSAILKVCGNITALEKGRELFAEIVGEGLLDEERILAKSLVSMYARSGALAKAQLVLNRLPVQDVVSWNGLISGFSQHGYDNEAVSCFKFMRSQGVAPNVTTFAYILKACGNMGALDTGREIHDDIVKEGLSENDVLGSALIDMYTKCGELVKAQELFDHLSIRSVVSWTTLMTGYYRLGYGEKALSCFEQMKTEGLFPDSVALSCLLKACSSIGATEKGQLLKASYGILPTLGHHICFVNPFSHAGLFDKAIEANQKVRLYHNLPAWFSFLCACQSRGNGNLGRLAFEHAVSVYEGSVVALPSPMLIKSIGCVETLCSG
ncbi:hypothetical protein GOP47_0002408 [Adiantum capillus-veneris]|uniref:Pentatricopeptide repeat-containing protein n=1 Tax=Adiantum capillus-veneris TaxID=13818 RepID=A0A9D4VA27_ADICA|nr:hypothetical protein GOP47_0002408 [Adiantum capillus-veneris]